MCSSPAFAVCDQKQGHASALTPAEWAPGVVADAVYLGAAVVLGHLDEADEHFAFAAELQEHRAPGASSSGHARSGPASCSGETSRAHADRARVLATAAAELADKFVAPLLAERARQLLGASPAATV